MAEKMTKRELFEGLMKLDEVNEYPEFVAGLMHEVELLDRKKGASKRESKITDELKAEVREALAKHPEGISLKELNAKELGGRFTSQKLVPVMKAIGAERFMVKKVAMFKLPNDNIIFAEPDFTE